MRTAFFLTLLFVPMTLGALSPVENFLKKYVVTLEDIPFDKAGVTGKVKDIACTGLVLGESEARLSAKDTVTVQASVESFGCHANWEYTLLGVTNTGDVNFTIGKSTIGPLGLRMLHDEHDLPVNASITACAADMQIQHWKFSSILGWILTMLQFLIKGSVESQLNDQLCDKLPAAVATASPLLNLIDRQLLPMLQPVPPAQPPPVPHSTCRDPINWRESTALAMLDELFEALGDHSAALLDKIVGAVLPGGVVQAALPPFPVPVSALGFLNTTANLKLLNATVSGLDTFTAFDVLQPSSDVSLDSLVSLKSVNVSVLARLTVLEGPYGPETETDMVVGFVLDKLSFNLSAVMAMETEAAYELGVGQVKQAPMGCVLSAMRMVNFTNLGVEATFHSLSVNAVKGDLLTKLDGLVNGVAALVTSQYSEAMMKLLRFVMATKGRAMVNELAGLILDSGECPAYVPPASRDDDLMNFETSEMVKTFDDLVNKKLGPAGFNRLIDAATRSIFGTPGAISKNGTLVSVVTDDVSLLLTDAIARGLDTILELALLVPVTTDELTNDVLVGDRTAGALPLNASLGTNVTLNTGKAVLKDGFRLSAASQHVSMGMTATAQVNLTRLMEMPIARATAPACVATSFNAANVSEFALSVAMPTLAMHGGTGPLANIVRQLLEMVAPMLPANTTLPPGTNELINRQLEGAMSLANEACFGPSDGADNDLPEGAVVGISVSVVFVVVLAMFGARRVRNMRLRREQSRSTFMMQASNNNKQTLLDNGQTAAWRPAPKRSMVNLVIAKYSSGHATMLRVVLPLLICACMAMKAISLSAKVAEVVLTISSAEGPDGEELKLIETTMIEFTFTNMVRYFWKSEAYIISLLIVFGTCAFPITKLLAMVGMWWLPLTEKRRLQLLSMLDHFGRVSFIDAFFLGEVMMLFKVDVEMGVAAAKLRTNPQLAVPLGMGSTIFCCLLSHYMLWLHHQVSRQVPVTQPTKTTKQTSLGLVGVVGTVAFGAAGWAVACVKYKIGGLGGMAQGNPTIHFYASTLPFELKDYTDNLFVAYYVMTVVFVLIALGPIISILLSVVTLVTPASSAVYRRCHALLWFALAWSGIDVLVWAFIAGTLEMDMIAEWMINNKYAGLCDAASTLLQAPCIRLDASFLAGFWLMVVCTMMLFNLTGYNMLCWRALSKDNTEQFVPGSASRPELLNVKVDDSDGGSTTRE